jgi:hypothetical protein
VKRLHVLCEIDNDELLKGITINFAFSCQSFRFVFIGVDKAVP